MITAEFHSDSVYNISTPKNITEEGALSTLLKSDRARRSWKPLSAYLFCMTLERKGRRQDSRTFQVGASINRIRNKDLRFAAIIDIWSTSQKHFVSTIMNVDKLCLLWKVYIYWREEKLNLCRTLCMTKQRSI